MSKKAPACPKCGRVLLKKVGCLGKIVRLCLTLGLLLVVVVVAGTILAPRRPEGERPVDVRRAPVSPEGPYEREAVDDLPAYRVVKVITNAVVGRSSDVIVPSLSPKTPKTERESIARAIAQKERLDEAWFYSTEEAARANKSASFAEEHPDAMKRGYLGSLDHGQFRE
ncbi:hypothetical protein [Paludisphaera mucosa]|uniref:hypothetical protein n=1 Tax=Paludisphaera mucosa TaxID=3030827 RepID=UPI0034A57F0D